MLPPTATEASRAVALIYMGALVLAIAVLLLGIGLLSLRIAPKCNGGPGRRA